MMSILEKNLSKDKANPVQKLESCSIDFFQVDDNFDHSKDITIFIVNNSIYITNQEKINVNSRKICQIHDFKELLSKNIESKRLVIKSSKISFNIVNNDIEKVPSIEQIPSIGQMQLLRSLSIINCDLFDSNIIIKLIMLYPNLEYLCLSENNFTCLEISKILNFITHKKSSKNGIHLVDLSYQNVFGLDWDNQKQHLHQAINQYAQKFGIDGTYKLYFHGLNVLSKSEWKNLVHSKSVFEIALKTANLITKNTKKTKKIEASSPFLADYNEYNAIATNLKITKEKAFLTRPDKISELLISAQIPQDFVQYFKSLHGYIVQLYDNLRIHNGFSPQDIKLYESTHNIDLKQLQPEKQLQHLLSILSYYGFLIIDLKAKQRINLHLNHHTNRLNCLYYKIICFYKAETKSSDISLAEFLLEFTPMQNIINLHLNISDDYHLPKEYRANRIGLENIDQLNIVLSILNSKSHTFSYYICKDEYTKQNEVKMRADIIYLPNCDIVSSTMQLINEGLKIKKILEVNDIFQKDLNNTFTPYHFGLFLWKTIKNECYITK